MKGIGLDIARYQRDLREGSARAHMDNRIRFQPGVEVNLARLAPLLRPLVMDRWARWTERANSLAGEATVHDFLFGRERIPLGAVRAPLRALQRGLCFYCGDPLDQAAPVDHFIPWARTGSDDLFNLVVSHQRCNGDKSDHLAALRHVERWRERLDRHRDDLLEAAAGLGWSADGEGARGSAYTSYWVVGEGSRLWLANKRVFEPYDPRVLELLTA
ncbi:HNH endonuclease [Planctomycetes bacterium Poly30]|uniref:HNH endonuclease n=1 Tax=Saltatorellus ferox TaxID=2528018 RepID=A0A518ELH5_9BACT|nr:HNH endonuclease [Planctomycetes bacterium Poly30]